MLIAPGITAVAVTGLLGIARVYDSLPIHAPPCGLRTLTGIPCFGCGGTRAMMALAHGHLLQALAFNPLIALAAMGAFIWLALVLFRLRFPKATTATRKPLPSLSIPWIVTGTVLLLIANWIYLILYLPR